MVSGEIARLEAIGKFGIRHIHDVACRSGCIDAAYAVISKFCHPGSTNPAAEWTGYGWFDRKFIVLGVYYPAIIDRELNRPRGSPA
jgi:hypothetical protein